MTLLIHVYYHKNRDKVFLSDTIKTNICNMYHVLDEGKIL